MMYVYVLDVNGQPLMPTRKIGKVRHLLKSKKAIVVNRCPFTIQLLYKTKGYTQDINLGIDSGSKTIGVSATTEKNVLFEAEVTLRNDIVDLLSLKRQFRRSRRSRKLRYRASKFNNRTHSKHKGWLAPSIENKIGTHITVINKIYKLLPITNLYVEVAAFDTQLLKAQELGLPLPKGTDYQKGEMLGFNTREYVLFRDGYKCRCCKGKSGDKILQTHHIESRKVGGDAPNNLVTLCKTCHEGYHNGTIILPKSIKRGNKYNDAVFMGVMRWELYNRLKLIYPEVKLTYGYITKNLRITNCLEKTHYIDARCISKNPSAIPSDNIYLIKKVRNHNRQIHKLTIQKGGVRKMNQAPYEVKGFRLFDKVLCQNKEWYINGRRIKGSFILKNLKNKTLEITPSKIRLINYQKSYLIEKSISNFSST